MSDELASRPVHTGAGPTTQGALTDSLIDHWVADYNASTKGPTDIVVVQQGSFTYVFDTAHDRLVGALGTSTPNQEPRDTSRMAGHSSYNREPESQTDRGHVIAHSAGGGMDINLVAQDHRLNISGEWRGAERYAASHPDTFVSVQAHYADDSQRPSSFTQGVVSDGEYSEQTLENSPDFRERQTDQPGSESGGAPTDVDRDAGAKESGGAEAGTGEAHPSDELDGGLASGGTEGRDGVSDGEPSELEDFAVALAASGAVAVVGGLAVMGAGMAAAVVLPEVAVGVAIEGAGELAVEGIAEAAGEEAVAGVGGEVAEVGVGGEAGEIGELGEAEGRYRVSMDGPEALEGEGNVRVRVSADGSEAEAAEDWAAEQEAINDEATLNSGRRLPGGVPIQDNGAAPALSPPIHGSGTGGDRPAETGSGTGGNRAAETGSGEAGPATAGETGDIPFPDALHDEIPTPEVPHDEIPMPEVPHDEIPMPEVPHHEIPAPETLHDQSPPPATPFDDGMPQHSGGMSLPA